MNHKGTVLIVDDEEPIRKLLKSRLEREGYLVEVAETAEAAEIKVREVPSIGLVLTDIKMPGKTGLQLTQALKANHAGIKVVVMTGHGEQSTKMEALRSGACDYLEKPFEMDEMVHAVDRATRETSLETTTEATQPINNVIPFRNEVAPAVNARPTFTQMKKAHALQFEKEYLNEVLNHHQGNVSAAAKESGLDRSNFLRLLRRHQIKSQIYRKAA